MKTRVFSSEQFVPRPRAEVFAFFQDHVNLARLTPPELAFKIVSGAHETMRAGIDIGYELKLHGVKLSWAARITRLDPPRLFEDEQVRGPYAYWKHLHEFEEKDGGTIVRDTVRYRLPFGLLGDVFGARFAEANLKKVFAYRRKALEKIFG